MKCPWRESRYRTAVNIAFPDLAATKDIAYWENCYKKKCPWYRDSHCQRIYDELCDTKFEAKTREVDEWIL
jgi:hypothetical protein